jgi:hypothetical protein
MKKFEWEFPDYCELAEKFDLYNSKNEDLRFQIDRMYREYNKLYEAMRSMTPEKIRFYEKLDSIISEKYFSEIMHMSHDATDEPEVKLYLFKNEPDARSVVQSLFDIYMNKCAERFKEDIKDLFEENK